MDRTKAVLGAIVKNYGKGVAGGGASLVQQRKRVTTGSLALDLGLGGGLAVGSITLLYGEKGGGKTSTAMGLTGIFQGLCRRCMRPAQIVAVNPPEKVSKKKGKKDKGGGGEAENDAEGDVAETAEPEVEPGDLEEDEEGRWTAEGFCDCVSEGVAPMPRMPDKLKGEKPKAYMERCREFAESVKENSYEECVCLWIDLENSFDGSWAQSRGIDVRRLLFCQPTSAEEAIDISRAFAMSGTVDFLVLDSIAQMTPIKEMEENMEKWQQGLAARLVNKAVRSLVVGGVQTRRMGGHGLTQIYINQLRLKIGVMFGDPSTVPGGLGQGFAAKTEVRFLGSKHETDTVAYDTKTDTVEVPRRAEIRFKITKNNTATTVGFDGSYYLVSRPTDRYVIGDVDDDEIYYKLAMYYCMTQVKGRGYVLFDREFKTQNEVETALINDRAFRAQVREYLIQNIVWGKK